GQTSGELRRVTRRAADVRRPDPRHDHDSHEAVAVVARAATSPRNRSRKMLQRSTKPAVETSVATPAPVTPHFQPQTSTSGISTAVSRPCAQTRSSGLPIETGSDFDQP